MSRVHTWKASSQVKARLTSNSIFITFLEDAQLKTASSPPKIPSASNPSCSQLNGSTQNISSSCSPSRTFYASLIFFPSLTTKQKLPLVFSSELPSISKITASRRPPFSAKLKAISMEISSSSVAEKLSLTLSVFLSQTPWKTLTPQLKRSLSLKSTSQKYLLEKSSPP